MDYHWCYPRTMPSGVLCWVRSVSGIECEATLSRYGRRRVWNRNGVDRVHCWRRDTESGSGDLWVIAWKPMDLCIDCDGLGVYPSGQDCKSCAGSGRVASGDGIPVLTGATFVCEVPSALGRVTKIKSQGGKMLVETESGTQMIVPTFNK